MAKKKTSGAQKQSGFMVRIPDWLREPMEQLKEKNQRPTTTDVVIALERYLRSEGIPTTRPAK